MLRFRHCMAGDAGISSPHEVAPPLEGSFNLPPRSEGTPSSVPLEAAFAVNIAGNIPILPTPGNYVIELTLGGNHVKSLPFAAVAIAGVQSE